MYKFDCSGTAEDDSDAPLKQLAFGAAHTVKGSDHRPVFAHFSLRPRMSHHFFTMNPTRVVFSIDALRVVWRVTSDGTHVFFCFRVSVSVSVFVLRVVWWVTSDGTHFSYHTHQLFLFPFLFLFMFLFLFFVLRVVWRVTSDGTHFSCHTHKLFLFPFLFLFLLFFVSCFVLFFFFGIHLPLAV